MKPFVSVIIPCRNEARSIARTLDSVLASDYPAERMEIICSDGMSEDGTREQILSYARLDPRVRRIDNPERITPTALNRAIAASRGEIVVRVDAHSALDPDFISKAVGYLQSSGAWNVGGIMQTIADGSGPFAVPIGLVLTHPFGVGNSRFRTAVPGSSLEPCWVDTVFGGCWWREAFARVGGFNERLVRSQDLEFNLRLRRAGGKILLAHDLHIRYWTRADLLYFLRHNWDNGVWAILPFAYSQGTPVRARHLVPLVLVSAVLASVLAPVLISARLLPLPLLILIPYLLACVAVSCRLGCQTRSVRNALLLPIAFASLHWAYGAGSLWGASRLACILLGRLFRRHANPRDTNPFLTVERKETS
jgi:cellulose synthase/poly-beta-1,6-N-acetylglucosamine synthase-like glycosyltransferase